MSDHSNGTVYNQSNERSMRLLYNCNFYQRFYEKSKKKVHRFSLSLLPLCK